MCSIERAFSKLHAKLAKGYRIEFPRDANDPSSWSDVSKGHGLGKGIAAAKPMSADERADYEALQSYIRRKIRQLQQAAAKEGGSRRREKKGSL